MPRLKSAVSGAIVSCSDETAALLGSEWQAVDEPAAADGNGGYGEWTIDELKSEIGDRNKDREEDDHIPVSGKKAELIARLEADDNKSADDSESDSK